MVQHELLERVEGHLLPKNLDFGFGKRRRPSGAFGSSVVEPPRSRPAPPGFSSADAGCRLTSACLQEATSGRINSSESVAAAGARALSSVHRPDVAPSCLSGRSPIQKASVCRSSARRRCLRRTSVAETRHVGTAGTAPERTQGRRPLSVLPDHGTRRSPTELSHGLLASKVAVVPEASARHGPPAHRTDLNFGLAHHEWHAPGSAGPAPVPGGTSAAGEPSRSGRPPTAQRGLVLLVLRRVKGQPRWQGRLRPAEVVPALPCSALQSRSSSAAG